MSAPRNPLQSVFDRTFAGLSQGREAFTPQLTPREVGTVTSVATGIAKVSGLPAVGFDELVTFPGNVLGIAFNVDVDEIGVVLLGEYWHLQDISAYIPTNLISIMDGQIYLSPSLFELGVLPAIDVGKSVSRVGGKAQRAAYRAVAGDLKLAFAQFEELETFSQFGARLDENTRTVIEHGRRIRACLKQPEFAPVSVPAQITVLLALTAELFDRVPLHQMMEAEHALREAAADLPAEVRERLDTAVKLSDEDRETIIQIARNALAGFQPKPDVHTQLKPKVKSGTDEKS